MSEYVDVKGNRIAIELALQLTMNQELKDISIIICPVIGRRFEELGKILTPNDNRWWDNQHKNHLIAMIHQQHPFLLELQVANIKQIGKASWLRLVTNSYGEWLYVSPDLTTPD